MMQMLAYLSKPHPQHALERKLYLGPARGIALEGRF
jgi:hypothetical protein